MKHPPMAKTELVNGGTPRVAPKRAPFQGMEVCIDTADFRAEILRLLKEAHKGIEEGK